jgi:hypothetical protein
VLLYGISGLHSGDDLDDDILCHEIMLSPEWLSTFPALILRVEDGGSRYLVEVGYQLLDFSTQEKRRSESKYFNGILLLPLLIQFKLWAMKPVLI